MVKYTHTIRSATLWSVDKKVVQESAASLLVVSEDDWSDFAPKTSQKLLLPAVPSLKMHRPLLDVLLSLVLMLQMSKLSKSKKFFSFWRPKASCRRRFEHGDLFSCILLALLTLVILVGNYGVRSTCLYELHS